MTVVHVTEKRGFDGIRSRDGWHHLMAQRCSEALSSTPPSIILSLSSCLSLENRRAMVFYTGLLSVYLYRSNLLFLISLTFSLTLSPHSACSIITKWRSFIYIPPYAPSPQLVQLCEVIVIDGKDTNIGESIVFHVLYLYLDIRISHTAPSLLGSSATFYLRTMRGIFQYIANGGMLWLFWMVLSMFSPNFPDAIFFHCSTYTRI
jgi:hypothetical protein